MSSSSESGTNTANLRPWVAKRRFCHLIDQHFVEGTEPNKGVKNRPWSNPLIGKALGVSAITASGWRNGRSFPTPDNFLKLLGLLFGNDYHKNKDALELVELYNIGSSFLINLPNAEDFDEEALRQIPASFRFGVKDRKIDALAETPKSIDSETSKELYGELIEKVSKLIDRLQNSNADPYALFSLVRLKNGLALDFFDVRPGIILSRMRNVESVRAAYSSKEGEDSLFPDAIAAFNDVCLCGQDFLATFPVVREIERQRIALEVERNPQSFDKIQVETANIQGAAAASEVVAEGAIAALRENEIDIQKSRSLEQAADLIADKLLIVRNFASEVVRSIVHNSFEAWEVVKPELKEGFKASARILPPLAIIALVTSICGPIAGLAGILQSDAFTSVRNALSKAQQISDKAADGHINDSLSKKKGLKQRRRQHL